MKYIFKKHLMDFFLFQQSITSLFMKTFDDIFSFPTINHNSFYGRQFLEAFDGTKVKFDIVQDFYFRTQ